MTNAPMPTNESGDTAMTLTSTDRQLRPQRPRPAPGTGAAISLSGVTVTYASPGHEPVPCCRGST